MNEDDHMVDLDIPQPVASGIYYDTCISTDRNIRRRCNDIKLENNVDTHGWDRLVNMDIFGVSVLGSYNFDTKSLSYERTSCVLFCALDEYIIDKDLDSRPARPPPKITGRSKFTVRTRLTAHLF